MSRLSHLTCFVFGTALALSAAALLMLAFGSRWPDGNPTTILAAALAIALMAPLAVALASRRWISGGQPLSAWLACFATSVLLALAASLAL